MATVSSTTVSKKVRSSTRVLERVDRKECIDDTIPLTANILTYKILPSHVEYTIRVQRGPNPDDSWTVSHRYNEFAALNQALQISGVQANLPPKKMFGNNDKQFLSERQQGLQEYLNTIVMEPIIAASLKLKIFLDPHHYSENTHEIALRNVSMFFRSNPEWQIVHPLREIGWRINKHYFLIVNKTDPSQQRILTWIEPGPDFCVAEQELEYLLKILTELKHPHIFSPSTATYNGTGLFVTRDYYSQGSLRDSMHKASSGQHHYLKACHHANPLDVKQVKKFGYQILDTLQYLLTRGFVLGHLSSGNIIIDKDVCKLIDLENSLIGLPSFHRTFLLELRKVQGAEAEAVYSFGHLLYEMTFGQPLKTATLNGLPSGSVYVSDVFASLLDSILSPSGVKALPTLKELISNPFFAGELPNSEKPSLKVPSRLKEVVRSMREKIDGRLLEDQRKLAQFRRMSRAQESVMSEEEKKKRQKKIRRQMTEEAIQKESEEYPTSKLKKQLTVPSSQAPSARPKESSSSKEPSPKTRSTSSPKIGTVPPPPTYKPPEPQPPPPPKTGERGALLSSIEGFAKGKLKKAVTNDRSGPIL